MLMRVLGANNPRMIYSDNYGNKMNTVFLTKMELKDGLCRPLRLTNRPTFPGLTRFSTYCVVVDGGNFRVLLPTPPKLIIATYSTEVDYGIPWSSIYGTFTVERFYPKPEPSLLVRTTSLRQSFSSVLLYNTRIHFSWDGNQRWFSTADRFGCQYTKACMIQASERRFFDILQDWGVCAKNLHHSRKAQSILWSRMLKLLMIQASNDQGMGSIQASEIETIAADQHWDEAWAGEGGGLGHDGKLEVGRSVRDVLYQDRQLHIRCQRFKIDSFTSVVDDSR